jgi:hypothetical protein
MAFVHKNPLTPSFIHIRRRRSRAIAPRSSKLARMTRADPHADVPRWQCRRRGNAV